jgi:glycosyltransferase involved in cell wall biosynthesis
MARNALSYFRAYGSKGFAKLVWKELFRGGKAKEMGKTLFLRLSSQMRPLRNSKKPNHEPWDVAFPERLKIINGGGPKRRVVYIYGEADTTTFRYRAFNMCQALNYSTGWVGSYFFERELPLLVDHLDRIDIVVFVRTEWSLTMGLFLHEARNRGIPVLFDIDDLICDLTLLPMVVNTLNVDFDHPQAYERWFSYASRLWLMGSLCDATIGTTEYLCNKLGRLFEKPSFIVNNFLNNEQLSVSEKLFDERRPKDEEGTFVIGYFSGTPWHANDFGKVAAEIGELMRSYPDITLDIVGFLDLPSSLNDFKRERRIVHGPLVDFLTLQRKIARADANIVPLIDNEFTNCKSELKFFEAAIVGTVTCATPTYAYRNSIQDRQTGFLCEEGQWYSALEAIYRNDVPDGMVAKARDYCLDKYTPQKQVSRIEAVLDTVLVNGSK